MNFKTKCGKTIVFAHVASIEKVQPGNSLLVEMVTGKVFKVKDAEGFQKEYDAYEESKSSEGIKKEISSWMDFAKGELSKYLEKQNEPRAQPKQPVFWQVEELQMHMDTLERVLGKSKEIKALIKQINDFFKKNEAALKSDQPIVEELLKFQEDLRGFMYGSGSSGAPEAPETDA